MGLIDGNEEVGHARLASADVIEVRVLWFREDR